jgi:hypothetical protein
MGCRHSARMASPHLPRSSWGDSVAIVSAWTCWFSAHIRLDAQAPPSFALHCSSAIPASVYCCRRSMRVAATGEASARSAVMRLCEACRPRRSCAADTCEKSRLPAHVTHRFALQEPGDKAKAFFHRGGLCPGHRHSPVSAASVTHVSGTFRHLASRTK